MKSWRGNLAAFFHNECHDGNYCLHMLRVCLIGTHCCFLGVVAAFQELPLVSKNCLRCRASEPAPAVVTF